MRSKTKKTQLCDDSKDKRSDIKTTFMAKGKPYKNKNSNKKQNKKQKKQQKNQKPKINPKTQKEKSPPVQKPKSKTNKD